MADESPDDDDGPQNPLEAMALLELRLADLLQLFPFEKVSPQNSTNAAGLFAAILTINRMTAYMLGGMEMVEALQQKFEEWSAEDNEQVLQ